MSLLAYLKNNNLWVPKWQISCRLSLVWFALSKLILLLHILEYSWGCHSSNKWSKKPKLQVLSSHHLLLWPWLWLEIEETDVTNLVYMNLKSLIHFLDSYYISLTLTHKSDLHLVFHWKITTWVKIMRTTLMIWAGLFKAGVSVKFKFRYDSFKSKFSFIIVPYNSVILWSKKWENYLGKMLLNKRKRNPH